MTWFFLDSGDPGGDRRAFRLDEQRPYWPGGVKLDSEIRFDNDGAPARHVITWVLTWDDVSAFFPRDYYAHDLYMDKSNGTFLEPSAIDIFSSLPLVQRYRFDDGYNLLRYGWASYRPAEIQAGVTYTVVIQSRPGTTPIDDFAEDIETYGVRIPGTCIRNCVWVPTSWWWNRVRDYLRYASGSKGKLVAQLRGLSRRFVQWYLVLGVCRLLA